MTIPSADCSPTLLISNLSDPSMVGRVCQPIIGKQICPEEFVPSYVITKIIPQIKQYVRNGSNTQLTTVPTIIRLILDNYPEIGYRTLKNDIIPAYRLAFLNSSNMRQMEIFELFSDVLSSIPSYYRDDIVIDLINEYTYSSDTQTRILGTLLIPIVHNNSKLVKLFQTLARDKDPQIRCAIASILINVTFDEALIKNTLIKLIKDTNLKVRQHAAAIFGDIAADLTYEYNKMLGSPELVQYLLPSLPKVVARGSFSEVIHGFFNATKFDKNDAAVALLETAKIASEEEVHLYISSAKELVTYTPFAWRLYEFASNFQDHELFLPLLHPVCRGNDWRQRFAILKQCEQFAEEFPAELITNAESFSEDQVAVIRTESVVLWEIILKQRPDLKSEAESRLMRGLWQKRQVFAKLVAKLGVDSFPEAAKKLAEDPVDNIAAIVRPLLL